MLISIEKESEPATLINPACPPSHAVLLPPDFDHPGIAFYKDKAYSCLAAVGAALTGFKSKVPAESRYL